MSLGTNRKTCRVEELSIAFYREGKDETVLLVHGITTYSFIWRNVFSPLADRFDVIAVDLPGCGDSAKPLNVSYGLKEHAERLSVYVRELGIAAVHFARCLYKRSLTEISDDLRQLRLPVLLTRGDAAPYLGRKIPGSRLVIVSTPGHYIQEDEPGLLADTLIEFRGHGRG